jgi:quercetin dioxygenase-like cupin family protein
MHLAVRCLPLLLIFTVSINAQTPTAGAAKLGSTVFKWEDFVVKPTNVGERRDVVNLPTPTFERFESHISTLKPGLESHPPHRHPQEEFIVVKEGTLEVFINGKTQRAGAGSVFFFASNDLHNMRNVGTTPATYFVFNVTTAATHAVPATAAAESAAPDKLRSQVFNWDNMKTERKETGMRREIVSSPTVTCTNFEGHITTLNPGMAPHAAHRHGDEELIVVKEGQMEVTINGAVQRAGPGSIFFYASNDLHGMKNVGTTPATYHVFRIVTAASPKP